jgi:ABC-2 type transport system ATP-binding protein
MWSGIAPAAAQDPPQASHSTAATPAAVTADPTVEIVDGVIRGNVNAVSSKGGTLRLQAVSSTGGGKLLLGNVPGGGPQSFTVLPYANWLDGGARGVQTFTVKVTEVTRNARATTVVKITVDVAQLAPEGTPVAFTYRVPSFDGTLISTNFFPAVESESAPIALSGSGLGSPGSTDPYSMHGSDPYVPGTLPLREGGYNVVTWDPRGEFASGGLLHLDNPFFEGRDVSSLVSWAAEQPTVQLNGPGDPVAGTVGGSYGGGIQLTVASMDPRIDAIVPSIAWNSVIDALNPRGVFYKEGASRLLSSLSAPSIRMNPLLRQGLRDSIARGKFSDTLGTLLASNEMAPLLRQLQAPTLMVQGNSDALFPLGDSIDNAQSILANPYGTPVKVIWIDPANGDAEAREFVKDQSIAWLDKYVRGVPIPDAFTPSFQWWDQSGNRQTSDLLPFQPGFNEATPITANSKGGSLTFTSSKRPSAINLSAPLPAGTQVVGAPTVSFTYRGSGTARAVFVQITGAGSQKVLGNVVTPIPVTLDGKQRTVSIPLGDIVCTAESAASLSIKIMSSSSAFASSGSGRVAISDVSVAIPKRSL